MIDPAPIRRALPEGATVAHWPAPDGWTLRRFDWPAEGARAGRGAILFQGGRGDVFEKYLETFGHWHDRGWAITSFDWRGQGGSGRLSSDPNVGHATDFSPWIADLAAFWRTWEATGPRVVIGHSMGGYLILRALLEKAIDPAAAVLVAPMLGLRSPLGAAAGEAAARLMRRLGDPARAAWKGHERPGINLDRQKLLTGDATRYADEGWWHEQVPALRLGPPSWAWLAEAFAATRRLHADRRIDTLSVPVLTLVADDDRLVDPGAAIGVAQRLPKGELVRFGAEAAHELLREADPVRDRALGAIDGFLDRHAA